MSSFVGLCLVGTGGIAAAHVEALDALGVCRKRWIVARTSESATRYSAEWAFGHHATDLEQALSDPEVDLVLITSPNELHAAQASAALRAEKHVIVEIPAAMSLSDTEELIAQADGVSRRLLVCHTMRSFPALREVRRRVVSGELVVSQVNGFFAIPRRANQSWAGTRNWIDNLLWHHGCHQVDAAMWALGVDEARDVSAHFGREHPEFGMTMDVSASFTTDAGQLVTQSLTYNTAELIWELRFVGDENLLTFREAALFNESGNEIIAAAPIPRSPCPGSADARDDHGWRAERLLRRVSAPSDASTPRGTAARGDTNVIDGYSHCGISKYRPVEDVLDTMHAAGVDRAVLCQHLGEYDNGYLASVVAEHPDRFSAVCLVDPASPDWRRELRGVNAGGSFRGLRIVADTLHENFTLGAEALSLGLTLVVFAPDGVAPVLSPIRRLLAERADGTIVITHLGSPRIENDQMTAGWELLELAAEPGVFVTLSGQSMFCEYPYAELDDFVAKVIHSFGATRLMWGSNYPVCGTADEYRRDLALVTSGAWDLGPAEVAQITGETARRLWFET